MTDELWTIGRVLTWTEQYFRDKGIETPRLDGEVLLSHMLGKERIYCYTHYDQPLTSEELNRFRPMVIARGKGRSVAYITGKKEFMGLSFHVSPAVLVPRPDTETLVEAVLGRMEKDKIYSILDMCTGSGAILLSLLHYLPKSEGMGVDISCDAIQMAEKNGDSLNLRGRAEFVKGNLFEGLSQMRKFDIIVSNPPYIPTAEMANLSPTVLEEPHIALDGGKKGLDFYETILQESWKYLSPKGLLAVEIGAHQEKDVATIGERVKKYEPPEFYKDLGGITRVLVWRCKDDENKSGSHSTTKR